MGKRRAEHKLDQDNAGSYDEKLNTKSGTFTKASAQELASRKIATARRGADKPGAEPSESSWPAFSFGGAAASASDAPTAGADAPAANSLWAKMATPSTDSYNCATCATLNKVSATQCAACEAPNPNKAGAKAKKAPAAAAAAAAAAASSPAAAAGASAWAKFAPAADEYQCATCTTKNKRSTPKCIACEEINPHAGEPPVAVAARTSASASKKTPAAAAKPAKPEASKGAAAAAPWGAPGGSGPSWSWGGSSGASKAAEPEKKKEPEAAAAAAAPAATSSWSWGATTSAPKDDAAAAAAPAAASGAAAPFSWGNASSVANTGFAWSFGDKGDKTAAASDSTTLWGGFKATPSSGGSFENVGKGGFGDDATKPDGGSAKPMQSEYVFTAQDVEDGEAGEDKTPLGSVYLRTHKEVPEMKEENGRPVETGNKKWIWTKAEGELQLNTKTDDDGKVTARLILRQPVTERVLLTAQVLKVPNQFSVADNCIRFNEFVIQGEAKPKIVMHMITAQTKAARKPYVDQYLPALQAALDKL